MLLETIFRKLEDAPLGFLSPKGPIGIREHGRRL
jgi:hypothetical protein